MAGSEKCEEIAVELTHLPTEDGITVDTFTFTRGLDTLAALEFRPSNPYYFRQGDFVRFQFPYTNDGGQWFYDWYGMVVTRDLWKRSVTAYDYGAILRQPVKVDRNRFVGEDPLLAILDLVKEVDRDSRIDTSLIHGTDLGDFILWDDDIQALNEDAWSVILRILNRTVDDSNDGYVLPFHLYLDGGKFLRVERQQDIDDATNFPAILDAATRDNLLKVRFRERADEVCNICTCEGRDGVEFVFEDANSTQGYSSAGDFRLRHLITEYDSPNLDDLQERAYQTVMMKREPPAEYDLEMIDGFGVPLNSILNLTAEDRGVDGRFLVTNIDLNSAGKMIITVSGAKVALADVV